MKKSALRSILILGCFHPLVARAEPASGPTHQSDLKCLIQNAENGDSEAQFLLGNLYINGRELPKNNREAAKWFLMSGSQNKSVSQRQLARMYMTGSGVAKDLIESYKWASIAASNGDTPSIKIILFLQKKLTPQQREMGHQRALEHLSYQTNPKNNDAATSIKPN